MSAIRTSLILIAALAALQACGHPARPMIAVPADADIRQVSTESKRARAERLVRDEFINAGGYVAWVDLAPTDRRDVFTFGTYYLHWNGDETCWYFAKGKVDVATEKITARRRLDYCGLEPRDSSSTKAAGDHRSTSGLAPR